MNIYEKIYEKKYLNRVIHTTLNPDKPGAVRIHLVPGKFSLFKANPSIVILDGKDILPVKPAWAILLSIFIRKVNEYHGREIQDDELEEIVRQTIKSLKKIYFYPKDDLIKSDLWRMVNTFTAIANHEQTNLDIGQTSIGDFAKYMRAPHRMDLMISSMEKDGKWHCNQKCIHCYAGKQEYATTQELSTKQWRKVIDICKKNCIAQLTFTGGEPTLRDDLVELINYSRWFVTRLNTNGVLLTEDLCKKLYEASLDSVQVTLYSNNKEIHNKLVGSDNFDLTVQGIKNAISSGLNVSINTPLCSLNKDYVSTLKFAKELGITYASSSGLIVTGKAKEEESVSTQLSKEEITNILKDACKYAEEAEMELSFTSPGWIDEKDLKELKLDIPACGACLSNMAIAPDGNVMPCQSWLGKNASLGNILKIKWSKIWDSKKCKKIRIASSKSNHTCPLRGGMNNEK